MPEERTQAIELLANHTHVNFYDGTVKKNILIYDHRGYASYSDVELLRAIQALAKKTNLFEVQNFITTIAADKFVLE